MLIFEKIKTIREIKDIKQKPISDALGLTVQAYSLKERGKRPITTTELEVIAKQLDVPVSIFFEERFNEKLNGIYSIENKKEMIS